MSSGKSPKFYRRLAFRLSLWCGGILVVTASLSYLIFYEAMTTAMRGHNTGFLQTEIRKSTELLAAEGPEALLRELDRSIGASGSNDTFFRLFDGTGKLLHSSDLSSWQDVELGNRPMPPAAASSTVDDRWDGFGHHVRVRAMSASIGPDRVLQVGLAAGDYVLVVKAFKRVGLLALITMPLLAVLAGWLVARQSLSGVRHLTRTAGRISANDFQSRVPVSPRGDEIDELAVSFNGMLDRIGALVQEMKQTNDNIAHELRSPITRMRGLAETTLAGHPAPQEYQDLAADTVEECDRLLGIINTMLDIAEAEAAVVSWPMSPQDLSQVARDACELFEPVAQQKDVRLTIEAEGPCRVKGEVRQLQRALANLIDNAIKYSPEHGAVDVVVRLEGPGEVAASISNSGPGIAAEDLPHIFERFYRGVQWRSTPGNGLGLSLSVAIARAHGGGVFVHSDPGRHTRFVFRIPAAQ